MGLEIVINTYNDSFAGHINFTLRGSHNGTNFDPITIGSNLDHNQPRYSSFIGNAGKILREDLLIIDRQPRQTVIQIDSSKFFEFNDIYNQFKNVPIIALDDISDLDFTSAIYRDWDPFAFFSNGTNCIHFTDTMAKYLGVELIDHLNFDTLNTSIATKQYFDHLVIEEATSRGIGLGTAAHYSATLWTLMRIFGNANPNNSIGQQRFGELVDQLKLGMQLGVTRGQLLRQGIAYMSASGFLNADPNQATNECFLAGTLVDIWDRSQKPIEQIVPGDVVTSFDDAGNLVPGTVTRIFRRRVEHILDFHGIRVTPGHVTLCGDGDYAGQFRKLIDIILDDGAVVNRDGGLIRASTNYPVGSPEDQFVEIAVASNSDRFRNEGAIETDISTARIRAGTRLIADGSYSETVLEFITRNGWKLLDSGLVQRASGIAPEPLLWPEDYIPKPESYILARSGLTQDDLYLSIENDNTGPYAQIKSIDQSAVVFGFSATGNVGADGVGGSVVSTRNVSSFLLSEKSEQFAFFNENDEGNCLKSADNSWVTYNFEVENTHTYIAGGIRVHNDSARLDQVFQTTDLPDGRRILYGTKDGAKAYAVLFDTNGDGIFDYAEKSVVRDGIIITTKFSINPNGDLVGEPEFEINYAPDRVFRTGDIGAIVGSTLGSAFAGDNVFAQIAAGSVLAAVLQNFGETIDTFFAHGGSGVVLDSNFSFGDSLREHFENFDQDLFNQIKGQSIGALSGFLAAELGEALGVGDGFGGQLFNVVGSRTIGTVLNTALDNLNKPGVDLFDGLGDNLTIAVPRAVGSFVGSYLAKQIIAPQTAAGALGASLGGAIGSYLGGQLATSILGSLSKGLLASAAGQVFGLAANFILPGIGAFIGTILGTFIGNLFGKKKKPRASGETVLDFDGGLFYLGHVERHDKGNRKLVEDMAGTARDILNSYITLIGGKNANIISPTQRYGHKKNDLYVDIGGTRHYANSTKELVETGVLFAIRKIQILGGDIYLKRAVHNSQAETLSDFAGDLKVAEDFAAYLKDKAVIDEIISDDPESAFAAGWLITLVRAEELGITTWQVSDFYGGLDGFFHSLKLHELGATVDDVAISIEGTTLIFEVTVDGAVVQRIEIEDFANKIQYGQIAAAADGALVNGTTGNDIWIAANVNSEFVDAATAPDELSHDILIGGTGNDRIIASYGWDFIRGGAGDDHIDGGAGDDTIFGGAGNDTIYADDETPSGQAATVGGRRKWFGGQVLSYQTGQHVRTPFGDDTVHGGDGDDTIFGRDGDDALYGDDGVDTLRGEDGYDRLVGGAGADIIDGGSGFDVASYEDAAAGVTVDLAAGTASDGDTLTSIEDVIGSDHDDTLLGDGGSNFIDGGKGADTIDGRGGVDTVSYFSSANGVEIDLSAGTGTIRIPGAAEGDPETVITDTISNIENAIGSKLNDTLKGAAGGSILDGGDGNDIFVLTTDDAGAESGGIRNEVIGGAGFDTVSFADWAGPGGVTVDLTTSATGNSYNDIEALVGSDYADTLSTSNADEVLIGGKGNDTIHGGDGDDVYMFERGDGADTVRDTVEEVLAGSSITVVAGGYSTVRVGEDEVTVYNAGTYVSVANNNVYEDAGEDILSLGEGIGFRHIYGQLSGGDVYSAFDIDPALTQVWGTLPDLSQANFTFGIKDDTSLYVSGAGALDGLSDKITLEFGGISPGGSFTVSTPTAPFSSNIVYTGGEYPVPVEVGNYYYTGETYSFTENAGAVEQLAFEGSGILNVAHVKHFLNGTAADDVNLASAEDRATWLYAGAGNDSILGTSQGDVLVGDTGDDVLKGGLGGDQYAYWHGDGHDIIDDTGGLDALVFGGGITTDHLKFRKGAYSDVDGTFADAPDGEDGVDLRIEVLDLDTKTTVTGSVTIRSYLDFAKAVETFRLAGGSELPLSEFIGKPVGTDFDDILSGGSGADTIEGGAGNDSIKGESGDDMLYGGTGVDSLEGGSGDDMLHGGEGDDVLKGGDGDDVLEGDAGADSHEGNTGTDIASYKHATAGVTADLVNGGTAGDAAGDTFIGIEGLRGSAFADTLKGDGFANILTGGKGDDLLFGRDGDDVYSFATGDGSDVVRDLTKTVAAAGRTITIAAGQVIVTGGEVPTQTWSPGTYLSISEDHTFDGGGDDTLSFGDGIGFRNIHGQLSGSDIYTLTGVSSLGRQIWSGNSDFSQADFTFGIKDETNLYISGATALDGLTDKVKVELGGIVEARTVTLATSSSTYVPNVVTLPGGGGEGSTYTEDRGNYYYYGDTYSFAENAGAVESLSLQDAGVLKVGHIKYFINGTELADANLTSAEDRATWFFAGAGDDTINGSSFGDVLVGDAGDDVLKGGAGDDQYAYWLGDGHDIIDDTSGIDAFVFGGIRLDQIRFRKGSLSDPAVHSTFVEAPDGETGTDLRVEIINPAANDEVVGSLTILNYREAKNASDVFRFADGTEATLAALLTPGYRLTLNGTENDDTLVGENYDEEIFGLGGNDTIQDLDGDDEIFGGLGNDKIIAGGGADAIDGGSGTDEVSYEASTAGVTVNLDTDIATGAIAEGDTFVSVENLTGSAFADTLIGNIGDNVLAGGDGDDVLQGGAGTDTLDGGAGADSLAGGTGDDLLIGGGGDDIYRIGPGSGNDTIRHTGGAGRVVFSAGLSLADVVFTAQGDDLLVVVTENDRLTIENWFVDPSNRVTFELEDGTAVGVVLSVIGTELADTITGTEFDDRLEGLAGDDTLSGLAGADVLGGGSGADLMQGGAGNDTYVFGRGDGLDSVVDQDTTTEERQRQEAYTAYRITYETNGGEGAPRTEIRTPYTAYRTVTYTVDVPADAGNDTLSFGAGIAAADLIVQIVGQDLVVGIIDPANPDVAFADMVDKVTLTNWLDTNDRIETFRFADGSVIAVADLEIFTTGTDGADSPVAATAPSWISGLAGNDVLTGSTGGDVLLGGSGDDTLNGAGGADQLFGGSDNDTLDGGADADDLDGGAGDDILIGGGGDDVYRFGIGSGVDTVRHTAGAGKVVFAASVDPANLVFAASGDNLIVTVSQTDQLTIEGWYADPTKQVAFETSDGTAVSVNLAPSAVADSGLSVDEDLAATIAVSTLLSNDTDPDGGTLSVLSVQDAVNGTVALDVNGDVVFTPASGYNGPASFTYTVSDGNGGTSTTTASLTVNPVNDIPVSVDDAGVIALEDLAVTIAASTLLANDTDADGDALTIQSVQDAVNGTVALDANGDISFTPTANYSGPASFTYTTNDGNGGTSTATVSLTVNPVNDFPVTVDHAGVVTQEDTAVTIAASTLLANSTDTEGDTLTIQSVQGAVNGAVALDVNGDAVFTPTADYNGPASFTYTVSDGNGGTSTSTVSLTINAVPDAPVAVADTGFVTRENVAATIAASTLLANDTDADGDTLTIQSVQGGVNGTVALDVNGDTVFTPTADYNGPASFTYTVSDGNGGTSTAQVDLSVTAVNLITGTAGDDNLTGTAGDDRIEGGAGIDRLYAEAGNDVVVAGDGDDSVWGADGDDEIDLGAGVDYGTGGAGNDVLSGGAGADRLEGGLGNDRLYGDADNDVLVGEDGDDSAWGGEGDDEIKLGAGADYGAGGAGDDNLSGNAGIDRLEGGIGNDRLYGGAGNDVLVGEDGDDSVFGEDGDDEIKLGAGADYGTGGAGNDNVSGGIGIDWLEGGQGDDRIYGGDGNDTIMGGDGADYGFGEAGDDRIELGAGVDYGTGGDGNDTLKGDAGNDRLEGDAGNDTLTGGTGNDVLVGGAGSDTYMFSVGDGADTIDNNDSSAGSTDKLEFGGTIDKNDLWFAQVDNDLVVSLLGTQDKVTIDNWYDSTDNQLDQLVDSGGTSLDAANVQQLVAAMAAFQPNDGTDATGVLPDQLPTDVQVAVDSAWQPSTP